jgi:hypothetical protein
MKKNILIGFTLLVSLLWVSCKKCRTSDSGEDPHNHDLLKKPLDQIKAEIVGRWQVKRTHYFSNGGLGYTIRDSVYNNNTGDLISFLANDTVRQTDYIPLYTKIYEKAVILKEPAGYGTYNGFPWDVDSVYKYTFPTFTFSSFSMVEIKNDTLVTYGSLTTFYLTRKP